MDVAIRVPEEVARLMKERWGDLPRRVLELVAIDGYRTGLLTEAQVQAMLGLPSRWEADAFLKQAHAYHDYTETDLDRDLAALRKVSAP